MALGRKQVIFRCCPTSNVSVELDGRSLYGRSKMQDSIFKSSCCVGKRFGQR